MTNNFCWTLTTGEAGMVGQAQGLAEALGLPYENKIVALRRPWRWMRGDFAPGLLHGLSASSDSLVPPWPEIVISCGRRGAMVAVALKRISNGAITTINIQDPQISPVHFDWVIPPRHDGVVGANVISTRGALHRLTRQKLVAAREALGGVWDGFPRPLIGVLIGGATQKGGLDKKRLNQLIANLRQAAADSGGSIIATPSRRTDATSLKRLKTGLADIPGFIWEGSGDNPFLPLLACADYLVVSADSVSMVSEAAFSGRPVYTVALSPLSRRIKAFHNGLEAEGVTRPFTGSLAEWTYQPLDDTAAVAAVLRSQLGLAS